MLSSLLIFSAIFLFVFAFVFLGEIMHLLLRHKRPLTTKNYSAICYHTQLEGHPRYAIKWLERSAFLYLCWLLIAFLFALRSLLMDSQIAPLLALGTSLCLLFSLWWLWRRGSFA